ncbi:MAG: hypothetical protein QOJ34_1281 [Pseudonocardiales bacterium]|jgi:hypothetical protein|nr:hypothetical protein [Pseudonocardiales bacterium]
MHRPNIFVRLAGLVVSAVLAVIGAAALTNGSSAALPIPFSQKVVKISDAYQLAQCSLVINAHDFNGNNTGYITAQSQANLLGGLVSSSIIKCDAYNAVNTLIDSYTYTGTSATMVNTRKNGSYGLSPTYKICITLTRSLYTGGTTTQTKCA